MPFTSCTTGWKIQQASQANRNWCAGSGRRLHPHALPIRKSGGPVAQHSHLRDHLLRCPGGQLWTGSRIWTLWDVRWLSCQQGSKSFFHISILACRLQGLDVCWYFWGSGLFFVSFFRSFSTTCGIKPPQICGTGRHWRKKLPCEST